MQNDGQGALSEATGIFTRDEVFRVL